MSLNEWISVIAGLTLLGGVVLLFWKVVHHN